MNILPEALVFLSEAQKLQLDNRAIVEQIERLIVLHFVFPLRDSVLANPENTNYDSHDQVKEVFSALRLQMKHRDVALRHELLPLLLDVTARAVPRNTFSRKIQESPWLETIFIALASRSGCPSFTDDLWKDIPMDSRVLTELFSVAISRNIELSLSTLSQFALLYSGLTKDGVQCLTVDFVLLSKIIRLSVDVFLPNSGLQHAKLLLQSLVSEVSSIWLKGKDIDNATFALLEKGVVIPLLNGFLKARDLPTFTQIWHEQLCLMADSRDNGLSHSELSIWENNQLSVAYSEAVKTMSDNQVQNQVSGLLSDLRKPEKQYAAVVLLDAIMSVGPFSAQITSDGNSAPSMTLINLVNLHSHAHWWTWRLLRLTERYSSALSRPVDVPSNVAENPLAFAAKLLGGYHKKAKSMKKMTSSDCRAAFQALQFILSIVAKSRRSKYTSILDSIVQPLSRIFSKVPPSDPWCSWDGKMNTMVSSQLLLLGYLTLLLAYPSAVDQISEDNKRSLFQGILTFVQTTYKIDPSATPCVGEPQIIQLWTSFFSSNWLMKAPVSTQALVDVLLEAYKKTQSFDHASLSNLLMIPSPLIQRHHRVLLLDSLHDSITQSREGSLAVAVDAMSLMARLLETPKMGSVRIATDASSLWKLAQSLSIHDLYRVDNSPFKLFCQVYRAVINRVMLSSDVSRTNYLRQSLDHVVSMAPMLQGLVSMASMDIILFAMSIATLKRAPECLENPERLDDICGALFPAIEGRLESVYRRCKTSVLQQGDEAELLTLLEILAIFKDEARGNKAILKHLRKIDDRLATNGGKSSTQKAIKCCTLSIQKSPKDLDLLVSECLSLLPVNYMLSQNRRAAVANIHQRLSGLKQTTLASLLTTIGSAFSSKLDPSRHLLLAGIVLVCLKPVEDRDEGSICHSITPFFTMVCNVIPQSTTIDSFFLAMECIDIILRTQALSVTQWNVDNLLSILSITVSVSGLTKLTAQDNSLSGTIYLRNCRVLNMLFGQYRQKLGGRMHLVTSLMQRLLRCLYMYEGSTIYGKAPGAEDKFARAVTSLPPWIQQDRACKLAVDPKYAIQFSRLLTLLCDPTVSAVHRGHHSTNALTDNTKKVKSLAGQHLQYVIVEYAMCQLRGKLSPAVKTALMPGLYAVLNVMTREGMRAMNTAMDGSSRAVFRGLYEDFSKFGRWNHD